MTAPERRRIELTVAVRDTDVMPKVANAGEVIVRDGERLQVMHDGVVVSEGRYHGAWMTEVIRQLRGHHEPQEGGACVPYRAGAPCHGLAVADHRGAW